MRDGIEVARRGKAAVALVTEQGYSQAEAGRSLGVGANLIGRWKREYEDESSEQGLSQDER